MKAIFDDRQWKHAPQHFMANGVIQPSPEQPERIARLTDGARRLLRLKGADRTAI